MSEYKTIRDLADAVKKAEEATILCTGEELRDAGGESRLKALARERVQGRLRSEGLIALSRRAAVSRPAGLRDADRLGGGQAVGSPERSEQRRSSALARRRR